MSLVDRVMGQLSRIGLAAAGIILLLVAGSLAVSYALRWAWHAIWHWMPIICAALALVGLAAIAAAAFRKK